MAEKRKPNELYVSRIYDAPVKMVWDAWTDPKQVGLWWGPRGFTLTIHSMDVRTGGSWSYVMHGPDGVDYNNKTIYLEVEKYKRMVYDHGGNDDRPPLFRVTVEFTETAGKTKMEMTMALATAEAAQEIKKHIRKARGESTWDRLAEYLSEDDRFVFNRTFEASREVMFDLWTNPKHFSQWLPPTGFKMEFIHADIKVNGTSFYKMTDGKIVMYGQAHYKEIRPIDRIVYTQNFCDKDGKVSRHPMAATWPETMLTTVTLTEEGPNLTRVTVNWEVYGQATAQEIKTFHEAKSGMAEGWGGSFDKLEDYIKTTDGTKA